MNIDGFVGPRTALAMMTAQWTPAQFRVYILELQEEVYALKTFTDADIEIVAKAWYDSALWEGAWDSWGAWQHEEGAVHPLYRVRAKAALEAMGRQYVEPEVEEDDDSC